MEFLGRDRLALNTNCKIPTSIGAQLSTNSITSFDFGGTFGRKVDLGGRRRTTQHATRASQALAEAAFPFCYKPNPILATLHLQPSASASARRGWLQLRPLLLLRLYIRVMDPGRAPPPPSSSRDNACTYMCFVRGRQSEIQQEEEPCSLPTGGRRPDRRSRRPRRRVPPAHLDLASRLKVIHVMLLPECVPK